MSPVSDSIKTLIQKRKALGLSVSTISRLLRIPENTTRRWESGESNPSIYYQKEIEKLLSAIEGLKKDTISSSGLEIQARLDRADIADADTLKRKLIQAVGEEKKG